MVAKINRRSYKVPGTWNDLTPKQLVAVIKLINTPGMDPVLLLVKLFRVITRIGWLNWWSLPGETLHENLHLVDFLFGKNTLTKNLLPVVNGFYGPGDNFDNLKMEEFVFSEEFFLLFRDDENNREHLNNLVSVLYREPKKDYDHTRNPGGDHRQPFNENVCSYNAKHIVSRWDHATKLAIAHFYDACRNNLVQDFQPVFEGGEGEPARWGLISMIRNIASNQVHGNFNQVEKMFVKLAMVELDEMKAEGERIKNAQANQQQQK